MQKDGARHLFITSQLKFVIPWALMITECVLIFKIWGCTSNPDLLAEHIEYLSFNGCVLTCVVLLMANFVYSTICNPNGERSFLVVFEIILFTEVIYNGNLLIRFIQQLSKSE